MRTPSVFIVLAALSVAPASAQNVTGVVVEERSAIPVDGAMVILFDSTGEPVDRFLTDGIGRYELNANAPGVHSLRVDRIGYQSVSTGSFTLGPDGMTRNLEITVHAIELAGLDVSGSRRCEVRPEEGQATARIWEEARKALEATAWTLDQGVYRYTLMHYTRDLDANGWRVQDESREFSRGRSQAPYISLPAERLVEEGFVHTLDDGRASYFAPDANVLLSDPFLDTHCMKLGDSRDGMVGLELEPVSGRRLPDIEGTLWLDAQTGHLKRLDFRYVFLRGSARVNGEPGGEVVFGGLPNGTWVVREWRIRMPLIATSMPSETISRIGYRDEGGVVWRVIDGDGTTLLEATTATIAGFVNDSTGMGAVADVLVTVATGEKAITGEDGSFLLSGLAGGLHYVTLAHPSLDSLGLSSAPMPVTAALGDIAQTRVMLPSPLQLLSQTCGGDPRPATTGMLFGRVLSPSGQPVQGMNVRLLPMSGRPDPYSLAEIAAPERLGAEPLKWVPVEVNGQTHVEVRTDDRGIFVLCDLPTPAQVRVQLGPAGSTTLLRTVTLLDGDPLKIVTLVPQEGGTP